MRTCGKPHESCSQRYQRKRQLLGIEETEFNIPKTQPQIYLKQLDSAVCDKITSNTRASEPPNFP